MALPLSRRMKASLVLLVLAIAASAVALASDATATSTAGKNIERLVVRGRDTVVDTCQAGVCRFELTDGAFNGTPVGSGAYRGAFRVPVAESFPNGEGGVCAPLDGHITLGTGTSDRLVLALAGDSCQDGAGDPRTSSFTGLVRFTVVYGTGRYGGVRGHGLGSFMEDANDHERVTLIGRMKR
jgi:hypothetical protein